MGNESLKSNNWLPLTPRDIPHFVDTLLKYPLSLSDEIKELPLQYFTLRLSSPDAQYFKVQNLGYLGLDPITPHDAVVHILRDPTSRAKKRKYLDIAKSFMIYSLTNFNLTRLTLTVVDGSYDGLVPADTYAKMLGFKHEGTMRQSRLIDGKFHDVHIFGILRSEV